MHFAKQNASDIGSADAEYGNSNLTENRWRWRVFMALVNRGQGATEYLVLLAVVLIIALVAIMLLGYFPGMATDAKITQSSAYWRGEARPFACLLYTSPSPRDS